MHMLLFEFLSVSGKIHFIYSTSKNEIKHLGDEFFNARAEAIERNSFGEGFSPSSKEIMASVIFLLSGGLPFPILLLPT